MSADQILALAFYGGVIATALLGGWCSRRTKQNRRMRRSAWKPGPAHPSFWNNDRRGDVECR